MLLIPHRRLSNNKGKFVDTAYLLLLQKCRSLVLTDHNLRSKIAGGQRCSVLIMHLILCIGKRNVEAVIAALKLEIPLSLGHR